MASLLRSTTNLALAPLRATTQLVSSTYNLVSRTSSEARTIVQDSIAYIRKDRTAPAAALVGLGPLLLAVIKDAKTESALKELLQLLKDALAILQTKEVNQLAVQSLSLLSSQAVTDLVASASRTVLSLLHVLQTPAVDKVRAQLDLYFSHLLSTEATAAGLHSISHGGPDTEAARAWNRSQAALHAIAAPAHATEEVTLRECVQLLLLLELLSAPAVRPTCMCPGSTLGGHMQEGFTESEARRLRRLVRKKDVQFVMLYRFSIEMARVAAIEVESTGDRTETTTTSKTTKRRRQKHHQSDVSDVHMDPSRCSEAAAHPASLHPTAAACSHVSHTISHVHPPRGTTVAAGASHSSRSLSVSDAALFGTAGLTAVPSSPQSGTGPRGVHTHGRTPSAAGSSSMYTSGKHRSNSSNETSQPTTPTMRPTSTAAANGSRTRGWYEGESDDEQLALPGAAPSPAAEEEDGAESRSTAAAAVSVAGTPPPSSCLRHVPMVHARFVFCVREMLADIDAEAV